MEPGAAGCGSFEVFGVGAWIAAFAEGMQVGSPSVL